MMVKLKIESLNDWYALVIELRKAGLLENVRCEEVMLSESSFPIEIPIDLEPLLKMAQSPIAKPFRKKISNGIVSRAMEIIAQED